MTKRELIRAVQNEVKEGKDRRKVFEEHQAQFSKPLQLATVISGIARDDAKKQFGVLNKVLVALLGITGLLKAAGIWFSLSPTNLGLAAGVALLGLAIPWLFAFEVNRFTGQLYGLLTILAGINVLNVLARFASEGVIGTAIDLGLLGGIIVLSHVLRTRLFPGLKLLGAKTDGSGAYDLG